jgi:hypothetical protein
MAERVHHDVKASAVQGMQGRLSLPSSNNSVLLSVGRIEGSNQDKFHWRTSVCIGCSSDAESGANLE